MKRSIQREFIQKNLIHRYDHPTADMVYQSIRQELPNISLGTVYRNLRLLVEQGDALSLRLGDGREHFDGHVHPHYHFICNECGSVLDMNVSDDLVNLSKIKDFSGKILGHNTYFYGICDHCISKH